MIRLTIPSIDEADLEAVREVLASGFLVQGPKVAAFEQAVADYVGTAYAVAVSNCTAALHLALLALDVGPGDLILTTAYSWPATANVIELCGAQPVFVDIRPDTFNIDPNQLEAELKRLMVDKETAARVKAILPVHAFGQMADMLEILELAGRYQLPVVEDAACALGAALSGRQAGTWGVMGCFSFHPRKAITTGEGGVITTNDAALARRLRALRNHGQDPDATTVDFIMPGFNYRLTEFQAAFGLTQMAKLDRVILARRKASAIYDALLSDTLLQIPFVKLHNEVVYQSYVGLLPEFTKKSRASLIQKLKLNGVETTIGTWHIPMTTYFRHKYHFDFDHFPCASVIFERALTLPMYEGITSLMQEEVVGLVSKFIQEDQ